MPQFLPNFSAVRNTIQSKSEIHAQADQAGKLIIEDTGSELSNVEPRLNMRLTRNASSFKMINNMVYDPIDGQWEIEQGDESGAARAGSLFEVGQEGIGGFTLPNGTAGDGPPTEIFRARTNPASGGFVIFEGHNLAVGQPQAEKFNNILDPLVVRTTSAPSRAIGYFLRETSLTNSAIAGIRLAHHTSSAVASGFGSVFQFEINGSNGSATTIADCGGVASGAATNTGDFRIRVANSGSLAEHFRVTSAGDIIAGERIVVGADSVTGATAEFLHTNTATAPPYVMLAKRNTSLFNGLVVAACITHETTQNASDGHGVALDFRVEDNASGGELVGTRLSTVRDGGTNVYDFVISTLRSGTVTEAARFKAEGGLEVDGGLGLHGNTPAAQASAIADVPTAGSATAADNATAINSILAALRNIGIIAT